jgi:RHS repeat-associated protein
VERDPNESAYGVRHTFTGRLLDDEMTLAGGEQVLQYRHRFMMTNGGRFSQRDPLEYSASMNLYTYVDESPQVYYDPFGLAKHRKKRGPSNWQRHTDPRPGGPEKKDDRMPYKTGKNPGRNPGPDGGGNGPRGTRPGKADPKVLGPLVAAPCITACAVHYSHCLEDEEGSYLRCLGNAYRRDKCGNMLGNPDLCERIYHLGAAECVAKAAACKLACSLPVDLF